AACAAATSRMRATVVGGAYGGRAGSCDRRLADLARKSLALVGGRVSGPVGQPTPSARWYTVERSSGKVVLYRLRLQGGNWLVDGFSPLAVASEADPRARVDALDSRLIGPRDAFVVNARTAPEVALSAFEGALWRGSGDAACAVATSRMRAAVVGGAFGGRPGSCGTRLGALAPKSLALVGGTVSGPVGPSTPSARWYAVERSTRTVVIYRMRLQGGRWLVDSFSPIGDRSEAAPRARADAFDLHLIGARQAFVLGARARPELLLRRFEHALWAGDGGQACSLASATLRSDIATGDYGSQGQDCQQRLGEIAKHVPQLIGSRVDRAATRVTSGRAVVSVKRWSGATVRYELRRAPGGSGWLVDRFSTTVKP
ncbi:MAG: hypothetical protein QOG63_2865, partial [Thermoleophilaceae bacterium]|nr:hypothetical protein [Thermoleophilaceae bacterium]